MQPVNESGREIVSRFIQTGVDDFFTRIWAVLWLAVISLGAALVTIAYRYATGHRDAKTMVGIGASVTLAAFVAAVFVLISIENFIYAATGAALIMAALFGGLWWMGRGQSEPAKAARERLSLDYDPNAPKNFSARTVNELFDLGWKAVPRQRKTELEPQKGLWIEIEGVATSIVDDAGAEMETAVDGLHAT